MVDACFRITWAGVSCLMSAVILSRGLRQLLSAQRGCASLAASCPSSVKYRIAHLSH